MAIVIPKEERDRVVGEYIRLELFIILNDTEGNPYYSYSQLFSTYDVGTDGMPTMFCPDLEPEQYKVTEEEFGEKLEYIIDNTPLFSKALYYAENPLGGMDVCRYEDVELTAEEQEAIDRGVDYSLYWRLITESWINAGGSRIEKYDELVQVNEEATKQALAAKGYIV